MRPSPEILRAKRRAEAELLRIPGVTGVDVGFKEVGGRRTDEVAIRVLVAEKREAVPDGQRIPGEIDGFKTDVIQRRFRLHADTARYSPLMAGGSVGPCRIIGGNAYAGTFGAIVTDRSTGELMALSNFHVLCVNNDAAVGDSITQPSLLEMGTCPADTVATLTRWHLGETVDCAVARLNDSRSTSMEIVSIGTPTGVASVGLGDRVAKRGRTTGLTYGTVDAVDLTITTDYGFTIGEVELTNQIGIAPDPGLAFGEHGDSGALVVNADRRAVGLYYAGDDAGYGVANPIADVLSALDVDLLVDDSETSAEEVASTYLGRPLLDTRPDFSSVSAGVLDDFTFDAVSAGQGTPWKPTSGPKRTVRYPFAFTSRAQAGVFRKFFSDRAGRRTGFWLPVYLLDYQLQADAAAGDTQFAIEPIGLDEARLSWSSFDHLVLCNWETLEASEITSILAGDNADTITLAAPLTNAWPKDRTICGGLIYARLADDQIDLEFAGLECVRTSLKFIELPTEYAEAHEGSAPVYLYEITRGGATWRYCDYLVDLSIGGHTWTAADITHGEIKFGIEFVNEGPQLTVATDDPEHPLRALLDRRLLQVTNVKIFEANHDTLTVDLTAPIFSGRLDNVSFEAKGVIKGSVSSILYVGEQMGPRVNTQRTCVHQTYDGYCSLNPAAWRTAGAILNLSQRPAFVEATAFGDKATAEADPNWFALGRVTAGEEERICTGQDGNRLYLNAPFRSAQPGDAISALAGDDKRIGTCAVKFGNVANFLGEPYMPNKNPQFEALETPKPKGGKKS